MDKQRKPDLASDNYSELEKKVDALMSREKEIRQKKDTSNIDKTEDIVKTAPSLPGKKDSVKTAEPSVTEPDASIVSDEKPKIINHADKEPTIEKPTALQEELDSQEDQLMSTDEDVIPDDERTGSAIREIIASEADELLEAEDELTTRSQPKNTKMHPIKRAYKATANWLRHGPHRGKVFGAIFLLLLVVGIVPASRYAVLNILGVRSSLSVVVIDESTQQPLRNVAVQIGDNSSLTDDKGVARLHDLMLGDTSLEMNRRAFAARQISITVGWGSNPLGSYSLFPTGTQYSFELTDYVSGKPVVNAEVALGETTAFSNQEGVAVLTVDPEDDAPSIEVAVLSDEYREDRVQIDASSEDIIEVVLAPRLRHFFVSERSGQSDVYAVYADGQREQVVLPATGDERRDIKMLAHPGRNIVAVSSTRQGDRNQDGFLLSNLTIVDLDAPATKLADTSERIQFVGWSQDRLVYVKISQGASGTNPERHQLISYDYVSNRRYVLAASNYFNGVVMIDQTVYYAPSSLFQDSRARVYKVDANGENQDTVLARESWGLYRTSFNGLSIVTSSSWFSYNLETWATEELPGEPARINTRLYVPSPDTEQARYAWVDERDGQGVLLVYDPSLDSDQTVVSEPGLGYPLRWLNSSTLVFRVQTEDETADYVVSVADGTTIKKLVDVTFSTGVEQWY